MIFNPRRGGGSKSEFEVVITGTPPSDLQAGSLKIGGTVYTEAQTVKVPRNTLLVITVKDSQYGLASGAAGLTINGEEITRDKSGSKAASITNGIPVTSDISVDFFTTKNTIKVTTQ